MVDLLGRFFGRGTTRPSASSPAPPAPPVPPPAAAPPATAKRTAQHPPGTADNATVPPSTKERILAHWLERADDVEQAWAKCVPGPSVAEITTRLSQVPTTFLDERVQVSALAGHVLAASPTSAGGGRILTVTQVARKLDMPAPRRGIAIALWLWASVETQGPFSVDLGTRFADRALAAMAFRLAAVVEPAEWIRDADRRDEAARTFLLWLGYLPAGEDVAAARGTLAMRDSLQQDAALLAAFAEHEHRLDVNRRLQAARAREASARYSHE